MAEFSLLCGRYGRSTPGPRRDHLVDDEVSLGDFVLAGGEVAALAIIEATARLVPGVMGNATSAVEESFSDGLLEYPHYTRPPSIGAGRCPRCSARATTPGWPLARARAWPARWPTGPT
ncbi:MAG: hypothetical protein R2704_03730 [Microthrixaceae bacterium]